jgi:hypothetical protein
VWRVLPVVLAALALGSSATAQVSPRPFDASGPSLSLSLRSIELDLGEVSALESPLLRERAITFVVQSASRWRMTVRSQDDFRGASPTSIPVERFQLRVPGSSYVPISRVQTATLVTGPPTSKAGDIVDADVMLDVKWEDAPGTYAATILFTLMEEP